MNKLAWMQILWPSFLATCVLEMLVFAFVDPEQLHWTLRGEMWPALGVYSVVFFVFWSITLASSAMTAWLSKKYDADAA